MRNLFDELGLVDKALIEGYTRICVWYAPSKSPNHPPGTISAVFRFMSTSQAVAFDVHACISPACEIQGSGMFDPKAIHLSRQVKIVPPPVSHDASGARGLRIVWPTQREVAGDDD
jgi:hypothetical protein